MRKKLNWTVTVSFVLVAASALTYTSHLQSSYPFLFSLLARVNPLNPQASPVVQ